MNDRGHAAIELALAVGVLLLPVILVVISFGPWSETRVNAEAIAAEAARAAVIQFDQAIGVETALSIADVQGYEPSEIRLGWCGSTPVGWGGGVCPFERGTSVDVVVEVWTPLIATPWGSVGGLWVSAFHSEPIDLYRSLG